MADEENSMAVQTGPSEKPEQPCAKQKYRSRTHSRGLLDGLMALREGELLFDVVLSVEGRSIQAHRILLAASCDYFRSENE